MEGDDVRMARRRPFARTVPAVQGGYLPADRWQPLEEHLTAVAAQAGEFGQAVGAPEWARLAGIWHDLGKYHPSFQAMLYEVAEGKPKRRVDHATAGAVHAEKLVRAALKGRGVEPLHLLLTATIAGHHTSLPEGVAELDSRLCDKADLYDDVLREQPPSGILRPVRNVPPLPSRLGQPNDSEWNLRLDFLIRLVFSAMIDADRLDAERVLDNALPEERRASALRRGHPSIAALRKAADQHIDEMVANIRLGNMAPVERRVYEYRQAVLWACRQAADWTPGAFSLDVATGGGKTLSSLSFALRHAERHGKDRVIVVIPYTSIIEQTASGYRRALGELGGSVIEHHSAVNEEYERRDGQVSFDVEAERRRLATENWDASLIVTTAVQFFESLYACTPSRCRKLHNIANSVVVLDEAQTLPPDLLAPTVWAMNELVEAYGASLVLSTATQPALEPPFPAVRNLRPIMPREIERPPARVRLDITGTEPLAWPALAVELASLPQVLCITHQRRDARDLTQEIDKLLGGEDTVHLSANMCPAHRSERIAGIRERLSAGLPCRVVSTQLVEAGVDLDFPVVYRAIAGFDSLAQAAGRANREGRLGERGGILRVFRAPTAPPPGLPRLAKESAEVLLGAATLMGEEIDIFSSEAGRRYFRHYYDKIRDKDRGITALRRDFRFETTAATYRFIRDSGIAVIIPWKERGVDALSNLEIYGPSRERLRRIQPYTVSVHRQILDALLALGAVRAIGGGDTDTEAGLFALSADTHYDPRFGLQVRDAGPEDFII
jgi:CRISPR-associated endonuclease/helicase Cas3